MVTGHQSSEGGMRVVIADDHVPIRGQIREALEQDGCVVCGEAGTAAEAVALAIEQRPDVVLLDIHMPGNGVQAAVQISRRLPDTPIVMLTQSRDDDDLFDSLRAGASGYLLKDRDPADLPRSLRSVLGGEAAMDPALVLRILEEFRAPARRRFVRKPPAASKLTAREYEVMELLAGGLTTAEVGQRLYLSPTTVRVHVSTVLRKLRVEDRQSAFTLLRGDEQ